MSEVTANLDSQGPTRVQLHLELPYKFEPREHPIIRGHLERGYRVVAYQRVSDREVVVTLARQAG